MATPMMKCGHSANAIMGTGVDAKPVCIICYGIRPGATELDESVNVDGREARCSYIAPGKHGCNQGKFANGFHGIVPSSPELPFFEHRPQEQYDLYYCGCFGWD
jgi:hypothetical protein